MDTTKTCATAPAEVRQFCESVSESTTKNIRLLKAIEQTVDWLIWVQDRIKADSEFASKAADHLKKCERVKLIDEDGTLCALFEEVESGLQALRQLLIDKRDAARRAPELEGDHKTAVVDEYTTAIESVAELHNLMIDLRWAVGEHDADLEQPLGPAISSAEEAKAYLESL
jgi:hypothetical protein